MKCPLCGLIGILISFSIPARAQGPAENYAARPLPAVKAGTPPVIDGDLSDDAWKTAPKAETFIDRQQGGVAPDQTVAWLLYDDKYLYVAFHCKDAQPDKIVARETVRDHKYQGNGDSSGSEDDVEFVLDPFQSHRDNDLCRFSVNPLGTCSAQLGGGRAGKSEWKGDWDGAARRAPDGWTAEMRIPWAILNYPSGKKSLTMCLNFVRFQNRTRIRSIWSDVTTQGYLERMGRWNDVQVPQGAFRSTLSLLPYSLSGFDRSVPTRRAGLDARYTLTPELTAVASLNPDFATIEGAVESIGFSRSERFVPERRPFFLEGAGYLSAGQSFALGPYFYSNRIPTFDLGAKVYGKVTPTDTLGVLATADFGNSNRVAEPAPFGLPKRFDADVRRRRTDVVARWRHDLSATAGAGFFFTQKSADDDNNTVGVLDQNARWGKFGVSSQWAFSSGRDAGGGARQMNITYEDKRDFTSLQIFDVDRKFRDANGLIFFNDFKGFALFHPWGADWRTGSIRNFSVSLFGTWDWHQDGRPFRRNISFDFYLETRNDWGVGFGGQYGKFEGDEDATLGVFLGAGQTNRFRKWGLRMTTGRQGGRPYSFVGPSFSVRLLRKLDLLYDGALQSLDGSQRQHILTMNYEMSPTRSFGGRLVVQNADTNWYLSFRNSGAKGTETYFILGDPNATRFHERIAVKFVFAV